MSVIGTCIHCGRTTRSTNPPVTCRRCDTQGPPSLYRKSLGPVVYGLVILFIWYIVWSPSTRRWFLKAELQNTRHTAPCPGCPW